MVMRKIGRGVVATLAGLALAAGASARPSVPANTGLPSRIVSGDAEYQNALNAETLRMMNWRTEGQIVDAAKQTLNVEALGVAKLAINVPLGVEFSTSIPIDGQVKTLNLEPYSNLAPNFRLIVQKADGTYEDADPGPVRTMRGTIADMPGAVVAATLADEGMYARIILADGKQYWIEPLSLKVPDANIDDHAIYRGEDVQPIPGATCGTVADFVNTKGEDIVRPDGERGSTIYEAQIGCDSDFEFFSFWGSTSAVNTRIQSVINAVNVQYLRDVDIRHVITAILVRSTASDPYTSTGNINTLLSEVGNHWNTQQTSITRDVVQMFTSRTITTPSGVIGLASLGVICFTSNAYSVVWSTCCGSFANTTDLSAHEIGHNWNAPHCSCPSFTMNPSLTGANIFSSDSIATIVAFRNTRGCLNNSGPGSASNPNPANGAVNVSTNPTLSWTAGIGATSYDVYFGTDPTPDSTPGQSELIGNQGGTSYTPPTLALNTTYYWRIDARNASGTTTGDIWSFSTPPPPPGAFNLLTPSNGSSITDTGPLLDWSPSSGAASYRVEWANNPAFSGLTSFNVTVSQLDTGLNTFTVGNTYYWRVFAIGSTGFESASTPNPATFSVVASGPPAQATNPTPPDGATDQATALFLGWSNGGGATNYDVFFGTSPTPGPPEFRGNVTGISYNPGALLDNTTYYWRIDARNSSGITTGPVWSFTTAPPANCPGDTNGDSIVNGADLSVLLGSFNTSVTPGTGADFNGDGLVNAGDLSVLLSNFGNAC